VLFWGWGWDGMEWDGDGVRLFGLMESAGRRSLPLSLFLSFSLSLSLSLPHY